jgi:hypothetical protein
MTKLEKAQNRLHRLCNELKATKKEWHAHDEWKYAGGALAGRARDIELYNKVHELESQVKDARDAYHKIRGEGGIKKIIQTNNADGSFGLTFL